MPLPSLRLFVLRGNSASSTFSQSRTSTLVRSASTEIDHTVSTSVAGVKRRTPGRWSSMPLKNQVQTPSSSIMDSLPQGKRLPLSAVVRDCERRWVTEYIQEANAGDVEKMLLLADAFAQGWGVSANLDESEKWKKAAKITLEKRRQVQGL